MGIDWTGLLSRGTSLAGRSKSRASAATSRSEEATFLIGRLGGFFLGCSGVALWLWVHPVIAVLTVLVGCRRWRSFLPQTPPVQYKPRPMADKPKVIPATSLERLERYVAELEGTDLAVEMNLLYVQFRNVGRDEQFSAACVLEHFRDDLTALGKKVPTGVVKGL